MKKKRMNRRRYQRPKVQKPKKPSEPEPNDADEDFIEHLEFMSSLATGEKVGMTRVKAIYSRMLKKWRQHSLSFWQKWCKLPEQ